MIERYATCENWARWFERETGFRVDPRSIKKYLAEANILGKGERVRIGQTLSGTLFPEEGVRKACIQLLAPRCGKGGFVMIGGVCHRSVQSLSRVHKLAPLTINRKIRSAGILPVPGKDPSGRPVDLYPEPLILKSCEELLADIPRCAEGGFVKFEGVLHGTLAALAKKIGVTEKVIVRHLNGECLVPICGRDQGGHVCDLFPEPVIRDLLVKQLAPLPVSDRFGFFVQDEIRYGTTGAWCHELGLPWGSLRRRLVLLPSKKGRGSKGRVFDHYPEPSVLEACSSLLGDLPQADQEGWIKTVKGCFGTVDAIRKEISVSREIVLKRIRGDASVCSIRGKSIQGKIFDFYALEAVRRICSADIQEVHRTDEAGFAVVSGIRYGTCFSFEKVLGITATTISKYLSGLEDQSIKGKDLHGVTRRLYPEPVVLKQLKDLLARNAKAAVPRTGRRTGHSTSRHAQVLPLSIPPFMNRVSLSINRIV
jgi:hypothetical protein